MKPKVDKNKCTGCGTCVALCPDLFYLDEDGKANVKENIDCDEAGCSCQDTVDSCPGQAISLKK